MLNLVLTAAVAVSSQVTDVTVYNDRARVARTAEVELQQGVNTIRFDELPAAVDARGIQVDGAGAATVLDVRFKTENFKEIPKDEWKELYDELQQLRDEESLLSRQATRLSEAKRFLKAVSEKVTHTPEKEDGATELDPGSWISMLNLYMEKSEEYDAALMENEVQRRELKKAIDKVEADIREVGAHGRKQRRFVEVDVEAAAAGKASLTLSYIVYGPRWTPTYDIRVDTELRNMEIRYFGLVSQNTGEDWKGVALRLSTANPALGGQHPELQPWRVRMMKPARGRGSAREDLYGDDSLSVGFNAYESSTVNSMGGYDPLADAIMPEPAPAMQRREAQVSSKGASVVFAVKGESEIASDNVEHRVAISSATLPATFRYSAIPKLDPLAYLKAKAVNGGVHPFLEGKANVFLNGDFVTTSTMEIVAPNEEFWVFLGADESMKVEHKLIKKYQSKEGMTGKTARHSYEYLMTVKNTHGVAEEVIIWDQIPISGTEGLKVKLVKPKYSKDTDALKRDDENRLSWFKVVQPGEEWEIPFSFHVEAPRDMKIDGLK